MKRHSGETPAIRDLILILGLTLGLALGLAACTPGPPGPTPGRPSARDLLERLQRDEAKIKTFAGRGSIRIKDRQRQHYFDVMVAAAQPDRLRLQAFDFMGRPILTLVVNRDDLSYLDYREARLFQGRPTPENLGRLLPVGLELTELITLLSGGPPVSGAEGPTIEPDQLQGTRVWRLALARSADGPPRQVWLTDPDYRLSRIDIGPIGEAAYRLEYDQYRQDPEQSAAAPHHIGATDLKTQKELVLDYNEVKLNPTLPQTLFSLPPPPGVKVEPLPGS